MTTMINNSASLQNLQRQYAENALLPAIDWQALFSQQPLSTAQITALETIYQSAVPLSLTIFKRLNFDIFTPAAYHPQGLGLFDQLAKQEDRFLTILADHSADLDHETRHQIWSMLLRGGAVLAFKAWLGLVKTGQLDVDLTQFDEVTDLLWIRTNPEQVAKILRVDSQAELEHIFLIYGENVFLERCNCLATAELFCKLGVYDPVFLSLRDEKIAEHFIRQGIVSAEQVEELQCALNPLNCNNKIVTQDYLI